MTKPRPQWMQSGPVDWKSFDGITVLRVKLKNGNFQHFAELDWAHFDGEPKHGKSDAEALAEFLCAAIMAYGETT